MLKRIGLFISCLAFSLSLNAQIKDRTMAISMSPLKVIAGGADLLFQYNVADFVSLTLPVNFTYDWPVSTIVGWLEKSYKGAITESKAPISFRVGLGGRFYPSAKGMTDGFYLEPRMSYLYTQYGAEIKGFEKIEYAKHSISPALHLGWDWFFDSGFYINFGGKLGYIYDITSEFKAPKDVRDASKWLSLLGFPSENKHRMDLGLDFMLGFSW